MTGSRPNTIRQRRVAWLLWLLLLLPMAQTAATLHVYSHAVGRDSEGTDQPDGQQALLDAHCDLCLTVAALIGGAPPLDLAALPSSTAVHELPSLAATSVWIAPTALAYESRAPPPALR